MNRVRRQFFAVKLKCCASIETVIKNVEFFCSCDCKCYGVRRLIVRMLRLSFRSNRRRLREVGGYLSSHARTPHPCCYELFRVITLGCYNKTKIARCTPFWFGCIDRSTFYAQKFQPLRNRIRFPGKSVSALTNRTVTNISSWRKTVINWRSVNGSKHTRFHLYTDPQTSK